MQVGLHKHSSCPSLAGIVSGSPTGSPLGRLDRQVADGSPAHQHSAAQHLKRMSSVLVGRPPSSSASGTQLPRRAFSTAARRNLNRRKTACASQFGVNAMSPQSNDTFSPKTLRRQCRQTATALFTEEELSPRSEMRLPSRVRDREKKKELLKPKDYQLEKFIDNSLLANGSEVKGFYMDHTLACPKGNRVPPLPLLTVPFALKIHDPRSKAASRKIGVVGFSWSGGWRTEPCDKLCGAAFLSNGWNLGPEGVMLEVKRKGKRESDVRSFTNAEAAFCALHHWDAAEMYQHLSAAEAVQLKNVNGIGHSDWSFVGLGGWWQAMAAVLRAKFRQGSPCAEALLKTGDAFLLQHCNVDSKDRLWGDAGTGLGKNWLGMQLMLLREDLRSAVAGEERSGFWTAFLRDVCTIDLCTGEPKNPAGADKWQSSVREATETMLAHLIDDREYA